MTDQPPTPELEEQVRQAWAAPDPNPAFAGRLRAQLAAPRVTPAPRARRSPAVLRWAGAAGLAALLLLAGAVFLALGPQGISAGVQRLIGYIPGVGVVQVDDSLRALTAPVTASRDGVTITVRQAILSSDRTVVDFVVDGIPAGAYPGNESIPGCHTAPSLRLPDGTELAMSGGSSEAWSAGYEKHASFAALAAGVNAATLLVPCLDDTLLGRAPENWTLALSFGPAPADLALAPVVDVTSPPPTVPVAPTAAPAAVVPPAGAPTSAPGSAPTPPAAASAVLPAIRLVLDRYIALDDGYYLLGHTETSDPRLASASLSFFGLKLFDAAGHAIPLEPADASAAGIDTPKDNEWVYRVYGKALNAPLTLRATQMEARLAAPTVFTLDSAPAGWNGADAQLGQTFPVGPVSFEVAGLPVRLAQARYTQVGDEKGFGFQLEADPALKGLPLMVEAGLSLTESAAVGGKLQANGFSFGGGSTRDAQTGQLVTYVLSGAHFTFPLKLSALGATLAGDWETTWNPPAAAGAAPPPVLNACLTQTGWQQALAAGAAVPAGLGGQLVVYGPIQGQVLAGAPNNYGLFLAGLDGRQQVLGNGVWPALAPDGKTLAYAWDDGLRLRDLASGADRLLPGTTSADYNPRWSPDGAALAFVRGDEHSLYVVGVDGQNLRRLATSADYVLGWSPDVAALLFSAAAQGGEQVKRLAIAQGAASGAAANLLLLESKGAQAALSPDGQWIAYVAHVLGQPNGGLYLARLDGSQRRLLAQLDDNVLSSPAWSPDGQWLAASVGDLSQMLPTSLTALIHVSDCATVVLKVDGDIYGWRP